MTHQQLQQEIISCLWSEDLKRYIASCGYVFTEQELLGIAWQFAPTHARRLELMGLLAEYAPAVADHAQRCVRWLQNSLDWFRNAGESEVFELRVKVEPDDYEERYLCGSFEAALEMIDGFYREYDFTAETVRSRYYIVKRSVLRRGEPFREDARGECVLGAGKEILSVDGPPDETENGRCCHTCMECQAPCVRNMEVCFPAFLEDRSPVRYRLGDGSTHYGIHLAWDREPSDRVYLIPLDAEMLQSRDYDAHWGGHWHEHIPGPDAQAAPPADLPEPLRENYHAFAAWLDSREK